MTDREMCPHGSDASYCIDCLEGPAVDAEALEAAVRTALRLAAHVASASKGDSTERGIDVVFRSQEEADRAREQVNRALESSKCAGKVSAWVWTEGSDGDPLTDAGRQHRRELRLQPHYTSS